MVDPASDELLLRALDQLPLPLLLLRADAATGELVVAYASARGRAFFGGGLAAGQPLTQAWPGLSAVRRAVLRELYESGESCEMAVPGATREAPERAFRVEPTRGPGGTVEGLLLTGLAGAAGPAPAVAPPAAPYPPSAPQAAELPLISFCLSADGQRTEYLSPQWFAYTGQAAATHDPATAWAQAVHPDDLAGLFFTLGAALEARQPWSGELRLRRHDGEYRWHLSQTRPDPDAAGRVRRWLGISLDIHEQHTVWERLRRREAQVRLLVEAIPQLVWTADAHGGITWVSEQWTYYTGLPLARSAGTGWMTALHPADRRAAADYWMSTVLAGSDAEFEFRLREASSGRYRWFVTRAQAQHDERGRPTGWFGTATDVHELYETRERLQASDQQLSQILGQVPAIVATLAGPDHRFAFTNPGYDELVDYRARLGRPVAECIPEVVELGFSKLLDDVYRTGEAYVSHEAPIGLRDRTGEVRPRYLDFAYQPLRDTQGQVTGILMFATDVSARVRAREQTTALQAQVRAADAHLRHLTEALPLITFTTDATGATTYMSQQWFTYTGQPPGESWAAVDTRWQEVLHPDDRAAAEAEIQASIREGQLGRVELRLRGADGRYRWFLTEAVPELDAQGRLRLRHGYMLDIDELRRARTQLEAKDQLLGQMLGQAPALMATLTGPEHRFTFSNAGYDELAGHRVRLGRPVAECLPEVVEQGFIDLLDNVYRTGQAHVSHEAPIGLRDRAGALRQRFLDFTYQPLRDGRGQISGILVFVVDVTTQVVARQRAEALQAALRAQDERLRAMTEALPQITYIVTHGPKIEYISPQWFAYTGQAPATNAEDNPAAFIHPDDLPRVRAELSRHLAAGTAWRYEFRLRRHDGHYRWHLSQGVPEPGPAPTRWYGSDTDIHELRELQEELRRGQARYRALTNQIPRQVWTANREGVLDYYNERAASYLGQTMRQLPPAEWFTVIHPADRARTLARWRDAVRHTRPYAAEMRLRRHDGRYRWHLSEATPETDAAGRARRWYGTNTDIHEQRELEQTLRRSEEQFRFLAESVPQIVWTSTGVGGNDYVNQRWFDYTGLRPAGAGDRSNWPAVIHPDDLAPTTARWAQSVATGEFFEMEYRFRRHDGVYRWFLGQGRAQRRPDGVIVKWFGTCTDIEDQKQAREQLQAQNEQLRRINRDLDQFVYTASHDLRQPINNMAGIFEELTRTAYFRDPDAVLLIDMFEKALRQIDDTIEDLTAAVQVQRQQPIPAQLVELAPLAQDVIGSLQPQIAALGARIELDFAAGPALPFVRAQLQSVLFNLLSNALKYALPGRTPLVRVRTARDPADQHLILSVQDNGRGLDLARHGGQLFQLFSRFHPEVEGSGMGLYLVSRVMESHGGRIEVQSQVGEGTTFSLHLPAGGG